MQISELVKKTRSDLNFTLDDLAKKSSLSTGFLSRLEKGDYDKKNISLETIISLANGLGKKVREVLDSLRIIESSDLPSLGVYLRDKYNIDEDADVKTIEGIINKFKNE